MKLTTRRSLSPIDVYLEWGRYDLRYPNGLKWADLNRAFKSLLEEAGYRVSGGEVLDGFGYTSWRNRTDRILETVFAVGQTRK